MFINAIALQSIFTITEVFMFLQPNTTLELYYPRGAAEPVIYNPAAVRLSAIQYFVVDPYLEVEPSQHDGNPFIASIELYISGREKPVVWLFDRLADPHQKDAFQKILVALEEHLEVKSEF